MMKTMTKGLLSVVVGVAVVAVLTVASPKHTAYAGPIYITDTAESNDDDAAIPICMITTDQSPENAIQENFPKITVKYGPGTKDPTPDDGFRPSELVPIDLEVQHYIWEQCQYYNIDYTFALAVIEMESGTHDENDNLVEINPNAFNGHDRGLWQVNKCWITTFKRKGWIQTKDDVFNPITNTKCGMFILNEAVSRYGVCERAYAYYNTGRTSVHSNSASRKVVKYWNRWNEILGETKQS